MYKKTNLSATLKLLIAQGVVASFLLGGGVISQAQATEAGIPLASSISRDILLDKTDNFRDLAGSNGSYQTAAGEKLKKGVIYRSNALDLSAEDLEKIAKLNIGNIYDLRTPGEIALHPDTPVPGSNWENRNLLGWDDVASVRDGFTESPEKTLRGAEEIYRLISADANSRKEIGVLLNEIADNDGAQVFHCSGGKDRTGWVSAILLHIAGVPRDVIIEDFMLSNDYSLQSITESFNKTASSKGVQAALAYAPFLGVQENWLEISFNEAEENYGSMDEYISKGLNISPETQARLKKKLVE